MLKKQRLSKRILEPIFPYQTNFQKKLDLQPVYLIQILSSVGVNLLIGQKIFKAAII